jgi:hypothetical protein
MPSKKRTVLSNKFERVGEAALDARKRVSLSKALTAVNGRLKKSSAKDTGGELRFEIHMNDAGQILLSPQRISPHEAWLYRNPKALASLQRGIEQAARGELHDLGSFAKYVDEEID